MELSNEAMSAAGFSKPYTQEAFDKYDSGLYPNEYSNTDWIAHGVEARKPDFLCRMVSWIRMDWL